MSEHKHKWMVTYDTYAINDGPVTYDVNAFCTNNVDCVLKASSWEELVVELVKHRDDFHCDVKLTQAQIFQKMGYSSDDKYKFYPAGSVIEELGQFGDVTSHWFIIFEKDARIHCYDWYDAAHIERILNEAEDDI